MKKGIWFVLLSILTMPVFANVALDELNALLNKKQAQYELDSTRKKRLDELREAYYFIFIYRSTCPHCHQFAPILKDFTAYFNIPVEAYSLDGESLEGFDASNLTPQLFQNLYVSGEYKPVVPALYLVNRPTNQAYAVLFGEAQPAQLAKRVDELLTHLEETYHD
ncbi:putative conjugative transfer protein TrbB [Legionella birminghamensis]|uniref:Conjugative transfer protein TrbB n=1 Tax=Legionella birminghamensis TaxID=28083 RepID=A0A378JQX1_9GAMM|nr:type-F conjugative transfer system pilin assembly thiol-disulfide isomerase TrbB [Legionella birminghamensis]KTC69795.1 putative conjugative transfer protein TrbB [Legionella birminghamensis]STX60933.1 putative conjugative transfer protein TrbB [Legionella birminghamensis]